MIITTDKTPDDIQPQTHVPWQYSLKGLFIVVAVVSICLAIGVHFAGWMFLLLAFGVIQAGTLFAADWLIRPQNRKWLAIVTAISWTIVGSGFLALGTRAAYGVPYAGITRLSASVGILLITAGVICYGVVFRQWQQLATRN
jgi:hypothetical protein